MREKKREEQPGDWSISGSDRRGWKRIERLKLFKTARSSRRVLPKVNGVYAGSGDDHATRDYMASRYTMHGLHTYYLRTAKLGSSQAYSPLSNRILSQFRHQIDRKQDIRPIPIEVYREVHSPALAAENVGLAPIQL